MTRKKTILATALTALLIFSIILGGCANKSESPAAGQAKAPENDGEVITWKMQSYVPPGNIYYEAGKRICDVVNELSGGKFIIDYLPDGAIVETSETLNAVRDGNLDASFAYTALWSGLSPAAPLFCSIPGEFDIQSFTMWMENGGGNELLAEFYSKFNVVPLFACIDGMEGFLWANKPIRTLEDMRGSKIRMMPIFGDVLKEHGMSVVFLPGSEIIPSLDRKVIDAGEYSIPAFDISMGYADVCKYYHFPGIHQPFSTSEIIINQKKWDELPEKYKSILKYAVKITRYENWIDNEIKNIDALKEIEKKGVEIVQMEPEAVNTMLQWCSEYMDKMESQDEFFAKVRASQKAFAKDWYPYREFTTLPAPEYAVKK